METLNDNIDHEALLKKIPVFTTIIRKWLKAGIMEFGIMGVNKAGTPQGGIISPLLANIALDGMERLLGAENSKGHYVVPASRLGKNKSLSLIRYADDFVITAPNKKILEEYVKPKLIKFLAERGMILSEEKTQIIHCTKGLDFLGFTVQTHHGSKKSICLTSPSKKAIQAHLKSIKEYLDTHKQTTAEQIIEKLNPIIRGWGNYYRYCCAKVSFNYVDHRIWQMIWHWCLRRHPNKGKQWVRDKYFRIINGRKWIFATSDKQRLMLTASIPVSCTKYVKVKGYNSPFDPDLHQYWLKRTRGNQKYMDWELNLS